MSPLIIRETWFLCSCALVTKFLHHLTRQHQSHKNSGIIYLKARKSYLSCLLTNSITADFKARSPSVKIQILMKRLHGWARPDMSGNVKSAVF